MMRRRLHDAAPVKLLQFCVPSGIFQIRLCRIF